MRTWTLKLRTVITFMAAAVFVCLPAPTASAGEATKVVVDLSQQDVDVGGYLDVTVHVYDAEGALVDVAGPNDLIEVRDDSGVSSSYRPPAQRISTGTYSAQLTFSHAGRWIIVAGPDMRTGNPGIPIQVSSDVSKVALDPATTTAAIALVVAGLLIVTLIGARVRKARLTAKARPNPEAHDTWWW